MATEAQIGLGTQFWLENDANTPVLTKLGEILSVTPPNPQTADVEATHMESPGRRREFIAGMIDDGEGTFEMNFVPGSATHTLIRTAQASGALRGYKISFPDGADRYKIEGECYVKGYEISAPIDDRMTATLTVRFSGDFSEGVDTP